MAQRFGVGKSTVVRIMQDVCRLVLEHFGNVIPYPCSKTDSEWRQIVSGFYTISGHPSVVGSVDGSYIAIAKPPESDDIPNPREWYCRKDFCAIILQGVVDHRGFFRDIVTG